MPVASAVLTLQVLMFFSVTSALETGIDRVAGFEVTFVQLKTFDLDSQVQKPGGRLNVEERCV